MLEHQRVCTINSLSRLIIGLLALPLIACEGDQYLHIENNQLVPPVPTEIRQIAALGTLPLELQITVNDGTPRQIPVTGNPIPFDTVVRVPENQDNDIKLAWFAITGNEKVLLADYSTTVAAGTTDLDVVSYNSTGERFDRDGDGRSNLSEAKENRNLLSEYDLKVPFRTSFGGVFDSIRGGAIDTDTSGDPLEDDRVTTFSLRHDGVELIVYICGQDRTLWGDNTALDGRYWHDDTVSIFLDGGDSDSNSYDQLDDFQIGFIRSTGEMRVSKGGNNPFCPNGDCISHSFYGEDSSTCEYELDVRLPLADLNIALNTPVGFDIEITDDDNGGLREGSILWIGYDDASNLFPSTFGTIILE